MDGLRGCRMDGIAGTGIALIEDGDVTEGDIGGNDVVPTLLTGVDGLEAIDMHLIMGIEGFQHLACDEVFLKGGGGDIGERLPESFDEGALSCRRVEVALHLHTLFLHHLGDGLHDRDRGIERGQDGVPDALYKGTVFIAIPGIVAEDAIQLTGGCIMNTVGTAPALDVTIFTAGVEDELQTAEAAVAAEHGLLLLRGLTPGTLNIEGRPDGRDIVPQLL